MDSKTISVEKLKVLVRKGYIKITEQRFKKKTKIKRLWQISFMRIL